MESEIGLDLDLWAEMAQLGLPAMHVPEEHGGAGFSYLELGIVLEELGRALTPTPMLSSIVLGANLVLLAADPGQRDELLPAVAAGERTLAVALVDEGGSWDDAGSRTTASGDDEIALDGVKSFVVDGHTADTLLVAATTDGVLDFYVVDAAAPGVTRGRLETMDQTRKQARIELDGVRVPASARLGAPGSGAAALARLYDLAAVALAFEQVGGAARCLEMAVDYAKVRHQFGRPIGSFQAIKHKCADMLVLVESAKSAAYYAGWAADADEDELQVVAPLAKSYCSDAFFTCAAENIQVHGGIGFTWEHDAHLYFKRAKTSQLMFGDPGRWRAILADRIGL
jgi:alkylation response protein AidB-like acyl-CoA dehydrogenase